MNAFDKVIGYDRIKEELLRIVDMVHNRSFYDKVGARAPQGILLHGDPGLGKTLMAKCFIEESGLPVFTVQRNKERDNFLCDIIDAFFNARNNAPSIVFLDDMDKLANEDENHKDADEYIAVQNGIDIVTGDDVFVLATVNDIHKLPDSLVRPGRFDCRLELECPSEEDGCVHVTI